MQRTALQRDAGFRGTVRQQLCHNITLLGIASAKTGQRFGGFLPKPDISPGALHRRGASFRPDQIPHMGMVASARSYGAFDLRGWRNIHLPGGWPPISGMRGYTENETVCSPTAWLPWWPGIAEGGLCPVGRKAAVMPARTVDNGHGMRLLTYWCESCGKPASYGFGVDLRAALKTGKVELAGTWWCSRDKDGNGTCLER